MVAKRELEAFIEAHGAPRVVEALQPYLTEARRARIEQVLAGRHDQVHVAIEAPTDPHNAAAVVRTCEALGVLGVHVIAADPGALHKKRTTQGAFHWVETRSHPTFEAFAAQADALGLRLCGATIDADVVLPDLDASGRVCLLFGNEAEGLSDAARARCDVLYRIPQVGMSESLNLSVSAAISLWHVLSRRPSGTDLAPNRRDGVRAWYYMQSVDPRLWRGLL